MLSSPRQLRVASVQLESAPADKEANFRKMEAFTTEAAAQGVRLVVFPECCISGYWFVRNLTLPQLAALAEPIPSGPSTQRLIALARRHSVPVGAGRFEAGVNGEFHDSYLGALPDGTAHCHRKLHALEHEAVRIKFQE